ncbi:MAG: GHKL domain-containing protein [Lachnospiraceae bacterium]|jgi:hypothetical protein|nr:GHKL domain-containing protein [Lachnospiraceae bacterium]
MMVSVFLCSNILTCGIHQLAGMFLICRLLSVREPDRACAAAAFSGALLLSPAVFFLKFPEFYQMAAEILWLTFWIRRLRHTDVRMSLFISIYYTIGVFFWQFLFLAGIGILFCLPSLPDSAGGSGQIALWALHLVILFLMIYSRTQEEPARPNAFRMVSRISTAGLLAVVTLSVQTVVPIPADTLFMWTILAVVLMMSVLVFYMNRQYEMERELAKLKSEQAELLEQNYTALNRTYEINAKLFHDFHNHAGVLRQLLLHERYPEAIQYLDHLKAPVRDLSETVWTGDETADYLINEKAKKASDRGIQVQIHAEYPRNTSIRSVDLCAILGNLLDNALEAAGQVSETDQRFIRLTIRRIHQMLVIKVENSFSTIPIQEDGVFQTTKRESGLHGWGLKSAQTAAEKYDGMVRTSCEGTVFRAVATLSWHGVSTEI